MLAQVNIRVDTMAYSIEELVRDVLIQSECAEISNVQFSGQKGQIGYFDHGSSAIKMKNGIILSTGNAFDAVGPNLSTGTSTDFFNGSHVGDDDLRRVANVGVNDVYDDAILEFDFVPLNDQLEFQFIFASEEYCDYAGAATAKNDVFGFFLSGPGLNGPYENDAVNIANLPGEGDNITVKNINHNVNYDYFVDNTPKDQALAQPEHYENCRLQQPRDGINSLLERDGTSIQVLEYDGYTVVLKATSPVVPFERYHLKIGVADVHDRTWDSAVFLEAGSFLAGQPLAEIVDPPMLDCHMPTITLDATASSSGSQFNLTWHTTDGHIVSGANTLQPVIDEPGTYTLIVSRNNNMCSDTSQVEVLFDGIRPEIIDANSSIITCDDPNVDILMTIDDADQFTYEVRYPDGSTSSSSNLPLFSTTMAGNHILYAKGSNGCVDSREHMVEIDTFAGSLVLESYSYTCDDDSLHITPLFDGQSFPFDFEWKSNNGLIYSSVHDLDLVVGSHGTYELEAFNHNNGCTGQFELLVIDDQLAPEISAGDDAQMNCDLDAIVPNAYLLNQTGQETIYWEVIQGSSPQPGVDLLHPSIVAPGIYALVVIGANGCLSTDTLEVLPADEAPEITVVHQDSLTCLAEAAELAISILGNFESISWSGPYGGIISSSDDDMSIQVLLPGSYEVIVVNEFGCQSALAIEMQQSALPIANAGEDVVLDCNQERWLLADQVSLGQQFSYSWTILGSSTEIANTPEVKIAKEGQYMLIVKDLETGCESMDTVEVFPFPGEVSYILEYTDCAFDMGLFYLPQEEQDYVHSVSYRQNTYLPNATIAIVGSEPIVLKLSEDCYQEIEITDLTDTPLEGTIEINEEVIAGSPFDLIATVNRESWEIDSLFWTNGSPPCLTCDQQTLSIPSTTTFELFLSDVYGCTDIVNLTIEPRVIYKVFVPSAFSPNDDGINDVLSIFPNNHVQSVQSMTIYSRWGDVLFQRSGDDVDGIIELDDFSWDGGSASGRESPAGVYVYDLMFTSVNGDLIHQTGSVTLIR